MAVYGGGRSALTPTQSPTGSVQGMDKQRLQRALGQAAVQKEQYGTAFDIFNADVSGMSADEKKQAVAKERGERILRNLENYYFKNKLDKGMSFEGVQNMVAGTYDRNNSYYRYKRAVKSARVQLARIMGDVGNLAVVEQLAQEKAMPDTLYDRAGATEQFNLLRMNMGLPARKDY